MTQTWNEKRNDYFDRCPHSYSRESASEWRDSEQEGVTISNPLLHFIHLPQTSAKKWGIHKHLCLFQWSRGRGRRKGGGRGGEGEGRPEEQKRAIVNGISVSPRLGRSQLLEKWISYSVDSANASPQPSSIQMRKCAPNREMKGVVKGHTVGEVREMFRMK